MQVITEDDLCEEGETRFIGANHIKCDKYQLPSNQ